jgi:hypothetical protein
MKGKNQAVVFVAFFAIMVFVNCNPDGDTNGNPDGDTLDNQIFNQDGTLYRKTSSATYKFAKAGKDDPANHGNAGTITITDGILDIESLLDKSMENQYLSLTRQTNLYAGFLEITLDSGEEVRLKKSDTEVGIYVYFTGPVDSPNFGSVTLTDEMLDTGWSYLGFTMAGSTPTKVSKLANFNEYKWYIEPIKR